MSDETELLKKRFIELGTKAERGAFYTFTDFLGLGEQSAFEEIRSRLGNVKYTSFGGADGCERIMIRFGDEEEIGYEQPFPIRCLRAEPRSQRFADKLTHRDFLGTIMNLGIERCMIGDIVILDNVGYIFVSEDIAPYIVDSLTKVKHTDLKVGVTDDPPTDAMFKTEQRRVQLSSERLDALIAKATNLSREEAQRLFARSLVYVNGVLCQSTSRTPKIGDKISVRGYGKMIYRGVDGTTRKGKLNATVDIYI